MLSPDINLWAIDFICSPTSVLIECKVGDVFRIGLVPRIELVDYLGHSSSLL
jgi:hypothetical protein